MEKIQVVASVAARSPLSCQIQWYYEQTMAHWDVLQPVSEFISQSGHREFKQLLQKSVSTWLPLISALSTRWPEYSESRRISWQQRLVKFVEWYRSVPTSEIKTCQLENLHLVQSTYPAVTWLDDSYPSQLLNLDEPPPVLYANHPWEKWYWPERLLVVIGSRSMSVYGQRITQDWIQELVTRYQVGVVSGGARGVDIAAQQAALASQGKTIGVCGCGLAQITSTHQRRLLTHPQAFWLSEFPPAMAAQSWTFVQRNRLIAGLAQGLLVIEAQEKSGTMITVRAALDQGKEVMVVPQSLWNKNATGIIRLANDGATLVSSPQEIVGQVWPDQASSLKSPARPMRQPQDPQTRLVLKVIKDYQGQLLLAELLTHRPPTITEAAWQETIARLEKRGQIRIRFGMVTWQKG